MLRCVWLMPGSPASYQDFLTLWEDADRDVPILKQAKAEYANLQRFFSEFSIVSDEKESAIGRSSPGNR